MRFAKPLISMALGVACLGVLTVQSQVWSRKTYLTFSQPVHLPGKTLPAGSYVFKLVDSSSNRHIVQVTNTREDKVYATLLTINDYRATPTSKTVVTFGETASCQPRTVKAWYYPGDTFGQRFVYSKEEAMKLATGCQEPVPQVQQTVITQVESTPKAAPVATAAVAVVTPEKQEVTYAAAKLPETDVDDTAGFDADPTPPAAAPQAPAAPQPRLPTTASDLPLLGLSALLCLCIASLLSFARVNR